MVPRVREAGVALMSNAENFNNPKWSPIEDLCLRAMYESGVPSKRIAALFGRTQHAVWNRAYTFDLHRQQPPRELTAGERELLDEIYGCEWEER